MLKEEKLTGKIIGLAMHVHRTLGPGFKEHIYHTALLQDLIENGYTVETEKEYDVIYRGNIIGIFRIDLLVNNKIILELKAISGELAKIFEAQVVSYLKASSLEVGLLLNFGNKSLQVKRFANYKNNPRNPL